MGRLVLTRPPGSRIVIGDHAAPGGPVAVVEVLRPSKARSRVAVEADASVPVLREELIEGGVPPDWIRREDHLDVLAHGLNAAAAMHAMDASAAMAALAACLRTMTRAQREEAGTSLDRLRDWAGERAHCDDSADETARLARAARAALGMAEGVGKGHGEGVGS